MSVVLTLERRLLHKLLDDALTTKPNISPNPIHEIHPCLHPLPPKKYYEFAQPNLTRETLNNPLRRSRDGVGLK